MDPTTKNTNAINSSQPLDASNISIIRLDSDSDVHQHSDISVGVDFPDNSGPLPKIKLLRPSVSFDSKAKAEGYDNPTFIMDDGSIASSNSAETPKSPFRQLLASSVASISSSESSNKKVGPSSIKTVLTVSAMFCVGALLIASGIILLSSHNNGGRLPLRNCGIAFLVVGIVSWIVCLIMQRKNLLKNVDRLERQLMD